jgi:tRNA threonylcarbamoyladenosine biosynthesis protein TsaE
MVFRVNSIDGLKGVAEHVLGCIKEGFEIVLLNGELGSGKTTLIKSLCQEMGVMEPVSSPTFSLVQEYSSPGYGTIYHMDLYRIEKVQDLVQIGIEEYLHSGNICFIEWPAIAKAHFTMAYMDITITQEQDNLRNFRITTYDAVEA